VTAGDERPMSDGTTWRDVPEGRSRVVVMGASADEPPPGIEVVAEAVDLDFAATAEAMAAHLPGADVLFAWRPRSGLLEPAWAHTAELQWIQSASAGVEDLLFPSLIESHVVLTNARGVFDDAMAEYVVGLLLLFAKGFPATLERQRRREWQQRDAERLSGQRVLVVGVGSVGRAIGRACKRLGMTVRGVATAARGRDEVFATVFGSEELGDACEWADWVVNALPSTPATRHRFDAEVFAAMPPTARFVNVGRGATVDEAALVRALEEGRLAGAALDVFEREPLPEDSPLWTMPNVIVSPHASANFAGWREALVELFVENLERYLTGRPLRNVVDKERGYVPA
jgi:phosphoglycerate dehydrogenase-like enzyme